MTLSARVRLIPAYSVQNSSQVRLMCRYQRDCFTCFREAARAPRHGLAITANASFRRTQAPASIHSLGVSIGAYINSFGQPLRIFIVTGRRGETVGQGSRKRVQVIGFKEWK